jgi:glycosyltransferase involved in cell wall biosynthesis
MKPRRIGIDWCKEWPPTLDSLRFGVVRYGADLLRGMYRIRPDLEVIVYSPQREPHPALAEIPWGRNGWQWRWHPSLSPRLQWLSHAVRRSYTALADQLDVIHCLEQAPTPFSTVPYVSTCFDLMPELFREAYTASQGYRRLRRFGQRRWVHHVAISQCTRNDLIRLWRLPAERVSLARLATSFFPPAAQVDNDVWTRLAPRLRDPDAPFLAAVFNLLPRKNLDALLAAFASLGADCPKLRLVLYGRTGDLPDRRQWFERTVDELGIRQRIDMLDPVDDAEMAELYRRSSAYVFPSLYEGFGLPVLEAMSVGGCVIARNASAMAEIVHDAGILTETAEPACLANAIRTAIDDPVRNQALRAAAIERAQSFTIEKLARETLSAYDRAIASWNGA